MTTEAPLAEMWPPQACFRWLAGNCLIKTTAATCFSAEILKYINNHI